MGAIELSDFDEVPIAELTGRWVAVDTECTGLHPWGLEADLGYYPARPFAFSFCDSDGKVAYGRGKVDPRNRRVYLPPDLQVSLRRILGDRSRIKILHNARFDIRMLALSGVAVAGPIHDTLVLAHVATGGSELSYGLKALAKKLAGIDNDDEADLKASVSAARRKVTKSGKGDVCIATVERQGRECATADYWLGDPKLCKRYALLDAVRTMLLFQGIRETVLQDPDALAVYRREMRLCWALLRMENRGLRVFPERISELQDEYSQEMKKWKRVIEVEGGHNLNIRSPKQLAKAFYEVRGHEATYTDKGNPKLNNEILHRLAVGGDRLAKAISEWRVADSMKRVFLDVYDRLKVRDTKNPKVWVLHPSIRQCGAVTGRMSCGEPNLLTVASESTGRVFTDVRPRPRYAFGPRKGYVWLAPDYSQMEVVMFAFLSRDPIMTEQILKGEDFHAGISKQLFGGFSDFKENAKHYRKRSKQIMFAKLYGGGIKKLATLIECSEGEAAEFVRIWENGLPYAMEFMRRLINKVRHTGILKNPFGRTYLFPDPETAYRAVNYIVQGTGSDILKNSMIRLDQMFRTKWKQCFLLLPIHDEILIEVPKELSGDCELLHDIVDCMQGDHEVLDWPIKLPVTMKKITSDWSKEEEVKLDD